MGEVRRVNLEVWNDECAHEVEAADGEYVNYADHAAKVRELEEAVATLRSVCRQAAWLAKPISNSVDDRLLIARVDKLVADLEQAVKEAP